MAVPLKNVEKSINSWISQHLVKSKACLTVRKCSACLQFGPSVQTSRKLRSRHSENEGGRDRFHKILHFAFFAELGKKCFDKASTDSTGHTIYSPPHTNSLSFIFLTVKWTDGSIGTDWCGRLVLAGPQSSSCRCPTGAGGTCEPSGAQAAKVLASTVRTDGSLKLSFGGMQVRPTQGGL